ILWQLQRDTGQSLLRFLLPLAFSLGITHSFVPPHPGIIGAVQALGGDRAGKVMAETIVFGAALGIPVVLVGWLGPGRWWARRHLVPFPADLAGLRKTDPLVAPAPPKTSPPFTLAVLVVTLPLALSLFGFGAQLLNDLGRLPAWLTQPPWERSWLPAGMAWLGHPPLAWLRFLGHPTMALFVPTGL